MKKGPYEVLAAFVSTIRNTGGLILFPNGNYVPRADPDWVDLGHAAHLADRLFVNLDADYVPLPVEERKW